jgi:hypothetical protein
VCTTTTGSQKPVLRYQRLMEILEKLDIEERSYVLLFLDANDRKTKLKLAELEAERRELATSKRRLENKGAAREAHLKQVLESTQNGLLTLSKSYRKSLDRGEAKNEKLEAALLPLLDKLSASLGGTQLPATHSERITQSP